MLAADIIRDTQKQPSWENLTLVVPWGASRSSSSSSTSSLWPRHSSRAGGYISNPAGRGAALSVTVLTALPSPQSSLLPRSAFRSRRPGLGRDGSARPTGGREQSPRTDRGALQPRPRRRRHHRDPHRQRRRPASARPSGPGRLYLCMNRIGWFPATNTACTCSSAARRRLRRTPRSTAAEKTVSAAARGLRAEIVSQRLNRRKIDLIPEPDWADPPKARIAELLDAVRASPRRGVGRPSGGSRHRQRGRARRRPSRCAGDERREARRDRPDRQGRRARWVLGDLRRRGIGAGLVLVAGDEFGPSAGYPAVTPPARPRGGRRDRRLGGRRADRHPSRRHRARRRSGRIPRSPGGSARASARARSSPGEQRSGLDADNRRLRSATCARPRIAPGPGRRSRRHPRRSRPRSSRIERAIFVAGAYEGEGPGDYAHHLDNWPGLLGELHPIRCSVAGSISAPACCGRISPFPQARCRCSSSLARPTRHARPSRVGANSVVPPDGRLDRFAVYGSDEGEKATRLAAAKSTGFESLLAEHRDAWARRWEEADVVIEGDLELQRAVRFALFHLMASVSTKARRRSVPAALRACLSRPRLLGQRRLRAAVPRRNASLGGAGNARVPDPPSCRRPSSGSTAWPPRCPLPLGVSRRGSRRHASLGAQPRRQGRQDSNRDSRSTSSWTSRGRRRATSIDRGRGVRGPDASCSETARYWASRIRVDAPAWATSTA